MADTTTFGVKVDKEFKEQIKSLMDNAGLTGQEFMQSLVNSFMVEKSKQQLPIVAEDLRELQTLTQRINNIYLNLGYRIENISKAQQEECTEQLVGKDRTILDLQTKNESLNEKYISLGKVCNEEVNSKNELLQRVNELTDRYNDNKALVEEYKSKNDMLLSDLKEHKQYKIDIEEHKKLMAELQGREMELNNTLVDRDKSIESLTERVEELNKKHTEEMEQLKDKHIQEVQTIKDKAEFEKEKALLEQQKAFNVKLEEIREERDSKIHEHQMQMDEHNAKYKELLEQMEQLQSAKKTSQRKSAKKAAETEQK